MTTKLSSAATFVAWNWAIESLTTFKKLDASVVSDLVKRTPGGPDNLGGSAKETFSFRVLESLFFSGSGVTKASAPYTEIGFDSSDYCAYVLEHILQEIPGSNLKHELEQLKRDVQAFIMHKRSSLPKCTLEQLKDAILLGSHPRLASLKERAGLLLENKFESGIHLDAVDLSDKFEGGTDEQNAENGGDLFEDFFPEKNTVPTKRVRDDNIEKSSHKDKVTLESGCYARHSDGAKKLKQDLISIIKTLEQKLVPLHGAEKLDDIAEIRVYAGTEECELSKELQAVDAKKYTPTYDDGREEELTSKEGESQNIYVDDDESEGPPDTVNSSFLNGEAKDDMASEQSDDNFGYVKEMTDIATKKHALSSYKSMVREENNIQTQRRKDSSICVHCNKGGQLLLCSSDTCAMVIHERCLKSADTFDSKGKFYCYFCAYSRLVSDFQDAKKRYLVARNNLAASICPCPGTKTNFSKKSYVS